MISKKHAIIWIAIISVTLCFITFMLTFFGVKNARNAAGEIYITNEQYNMLMRYYDLNKVEQLVNDHYYKEPDGGELLEGAKKGLVSALNDPYSVYYTAEEYTSLFDKLDGVYTGVGIVISADKESGLIKVLHVYMDSPASEAEIMVGDTLIAVNGENIMGTDLESAAEKMRGPDGTKFTLTILRDGNQLVKELTRRPVEADKATYTAYEDIGYIKIYEFTGNCVDVFKQAMEEMKNDGDTRGLILDLRDNPGGRLTSATDICDLLLAQCDIVYVEDREGNRVAQSSGASMWDIPMAVLVNGNSASASEIVAGALQDNGRAAIVGKTTFGKGVVQDIYPIPEDGTGVKITTGTYYTTNGRAVNGVGIVPDYDVDAGVIGEAETLTPENDLQLQKAMEVLKAQIGDINNAEE